MNYLEIMNELCKENEGYIVIMRSGVFYTAVGYNAIKLSELFGLKLICMTEGLCKCSFPKVALEKYITKFQKSNYSFDEIADYSYWQLQQNDRVIINGNVEENGEIVMQELPQTLDKII